MVSLMGTVVNGIRSYRTNKSSHCTNLTPLTTAGPVINDTTAMCTNFRSIKVELTSLPEVSASVLHFGYVCLYVCKFVCRTRN